MSSLLNHDALAEATDVLRSSMRSAFGVELRGNYARVAERVITTYLEGRADKEWRLSENTRILLRMKVGEEVYLAATCKQNLHGAMKTARKKMNCLTAKWRIEEVRSEYWRIVRLPDGANAMKRDPMRNPKAVFLAAIPVGQARVWLSGNKSWDVCNDNNKNKARAILQDPSANWRGRRLHEGGYEIRRIK